MQIGSIQNRVINSFPVIFFFIPYFGLVPIAYGLMLLLIISKISGKFKINSYDLFIIICLFALSLSKYFQTSFLVADSIFRYYLGIVITYYFLKTYRIEINVQQLLLYFCLAVFIESIIINVFFDPFRYLPNYPKSVFENQINSHYTKFMGFYQRPYSVGMNASCSSAILCGLMMCRWEMIKKSQIIENKYIEYIGAVTVLLFASGVGIGLYFFYLIHRFRLITINRFLLLLIISFLVITNYDAIFSIFSTDSIFQKVSSVYINFLVDYKYIQIEDVIKILKFKENSVFIGQAFERKADVITQSDFAWNDFFQSLGILGICLFFLFILNKINKHTFFPILLFIIGAFHYGGIFTLPGQIVCGILFVQLSNSPELEEYV